MPHSAPPLTDARMAAHEPLISRRKRRFRRPEMAPRIVSLGTAAPKRAYTQEQVLDLFDERNPKIRNLFLNSHIRKRHLYMPELVDGRLPDETNQQLIDKHLNGALEIGGAAIEHALAEQCLGPDEVDFFTCMTTTGLLSPGLTAHLSRKMGFRDDVKRFDVVGMGCNAAMNGFQVMSGLSRSMPGKIGLMCCVEVCSAAYSPSRKLSTAVVNSLFGDGAGACVIRTDGSDDWTMGPMMVDFESYILTEKIEAMKYELDGTKLSFFLDRDIPYVIGLHVEHPVGRLLKRHGLKQRDIDHWIVHSGGKKVIDAIKYNLGLVEHDMRHTLHVLSEYGNVSSASVLFSLNELCLENTVKEGDLGVMIAMGPGTSIETSLLAW